jgi:hypothetical protein
MANPFPFTAGQVLTAAQMNGIGEYVAYTPTWTNLTVGNGTVAFRYGRVQDFVHVHGRLTFGSTTSVSGAIAFGLPVAAINQDDGTILGDLRLDDASPGALYLGVIFKSGTSNGGINSLSVSGSVITGASTSATDPFTWAVNDIIRVNFIYEI